MKTFHLFYEKRRKKANARTHTFFYENTTTKTELKTIHSQLRLLEKKKEAHTFSIRKTKNSKKTFHLDYGEKKRRKKKANTRTHTFFYENKKYCTLCLLKEGIVESSPNSKINSS